MDNVKNQLAERLQSANNILVTVSRDPTVDQLASLIGLTLSLNKIGKHAAAVFSGEIPSTLEFLQPEETIEKNTDSLQDFIIALDKAKADKLRYKVEDDIVRIFITPYKTPISEEDLQFSEGDFNVDVVVALGVQQQDDLDDAITKHGRILHDATVTSINTSVDGGLGNINWHDNQASSLSELVTELIQAVDQNGLDNQIATALLTGIVAATDRFSNDKTSSLTMSASAALMNAGANQQLVASKLEEELTPIEQLQSDQPEQSTTPKEADDAVGVLEIEHVDGEDGPSQDEALNSEPSQPVEQYQEPQKEQSQPEEPVNQEENDQEPIDGIKTSKIMTEAPRLGGTLTANSRPEEMMLSPSTDPMSAPQGDDSQLLNRDKQNLGPAPADWVPPQPKDPRDRTLQDLEYAVNSHHLERDAAQTQAQDQQANLDAMRQEVESAAGPDPVANNPVQSLNAQPIGGDSLHQNNAMPQMEQPAPTDAFTPPQPQPMQPPVDNQAPMPNDPNAPPPVPPPIPFQFNDQNQQQ